MWFVEQNLKTEVNMLFRGRIALDNLDIENIEDGTKDYHSHGVSVYNGWKVRYDHMYAHTNTHNYQQRMLFIEC